MTRFLTTSCLVLLAVDREVDWKWAIPSENEWYKAAYHKNDGDTGNYFDYPTSSDSIDTSMANYDGGAAAGQTTDVDSYAYPSPYDTFDQGGNLTEWTEAVIGSYRGNGGGYWEDDSSYLAAAGRYA